jgi:hypothetical protein
MNGSTLEPLASSEENLQVQWKRLTVLLSTLHSRLADVFLKETGCMTQGLDFRIRQERVQHLLNPLTS